MRNSRRIILLIVVAVVIAGIYVPIMLFKPTESYPDPKRPKLGLDLEGGTRITLQALGSPSEDEMGVARDIVENRVNSLGLTEPVVAVEGNSRLVVELPGEKNPERVLQIIGSTAQLQFRKLESALVPGSAEYDSTPLTDVNVTDEESFQRLRDEPVVLPFDLRGSEQRMKLGPTLLTGDIISSADANAAEDGGYEIAFALKDEAKAEFARVTTELLNQQMAIVLDYEVKSAPMVQSAITEGEGRITGDFSREEARDLALVLRLGALPVQFQPEPLRREVISPTLGRSSLNKGLAAGIAGLGLVMLFMLIFYRGLGLVSTGALLIFVALAYGIMVILGHVAGSTLTLAGITGLIVSVGISADSSVVYFERLKEEVRQGVPLRTCADRAYKSAFRTIIAADFVTFAAALILYILAIGAVRGFAFALGLATVLDVFISYFYTHNAVALLARLKPYKKPSFIGVGERTVEVKG
ncbi:MAG: protein translocase subunit SecD [Candidatus Geothermincolia bacterium]